MDSDLGINSEKSDIVKSKILRRDALISLTFFI
jgi:hypothetical protein